MKRKMCGQYVHGINRPGSSCQAGSTGHAGVSLIPLGLMTKGDMAEIAEIRTPPDRIHPESRSRLEEMGLRVGKSVHVLSNGGDGALLVMVDETRIAMSRGTAMKIIAKRRTP